MMRSRLWLITGIALFGIVPTPGLVGRVVLVGPGDDLREAVENNPPGAQFHLKPGTYRLQQVKPKGGDSFVGEGASTVLTGAVVLTRFLKVGAWFIARYAAPQEQVHGTCNSGSPLCDHPMDCYFDNEPLRRVGTPADLKQGDWFLDAAHDEIVLGRDPAGHLVEVSSARSAFSGPAANITIIGLTVEKYAIPAQWGAIGDQSPGPHWEIRNCIVRLNHGAGIAVSDGSIVRGNQILRNGQLGVAGHGKNLLIENNEIAGNNYAGFDAGWEAGGAKFSKTDGLRVAKNSVHDNLGPGLWTDFENKNTVYEANTVTNNGGEGIKHEISFEARIVDNVVSGNGRFSVWLWGAQILIQNSSHVEVTGNKVTVPPDYGNGIAVILQNRGSYVASDNRIHDNDITNLDASRGATGVACDYELECNLLETNHFDGNHYHVPVLGRYHWFWRQSERWEEFQQKHGAEVHGSVDSNLRPTK